MTGVKWLDDGGWICPACGLTCEAGWRVCPACDFALGAEDHPPLPEEDPQDIPKPEF